jgi:hypothetical protein
VPPPSDIVVACHEIDRLCNGGVEHIQLILTAQNLGQYTTLYIPNTHQMRADDDFIPKFIELFDAKDVCLQLGDVVDAREGVMLAALALEDMVLVRVLYPEYHGSPVTAQKFGYDRFPPTANGWGTTHPLPDITPPLLAKERGPPT